MLAIKNVKQKPRKKQNQQQQKKKKRTKKNNPRSNGRPGTFQLSQCSNTYLKALLDPFSLVTGACIPDLIDRPSLKTRSVIRGTCSVGTQGVGYVVVDPLCGLADAYSALLTSASFGDVHVLNSTPGVLPVFNNQSPYRQSDVPTRVNFRVVACGLRLRYIGTELNRGGRYICHRLPSVQNYGNFTSEDILTRPDAVSTPVDRKWHGVSYAPTSEEDYSYKNTPDAIPNSGITDIPRANMIVFIDSTPGNQFEFELVYYHEFVPGNYRVDGGIPGSSPSHSDVPGISAIRNVLQDKIVQPGPSAYTTAFNWLAENTVNTMSTLATVAMKNPAATRALINAAPLLLTL